MTKFILKGSQIQKFTDEEFLNLCSENEDLKIERLSNNMVSIEARSTLFGTHLQAVIISQIVKWQKVTKLGSLLTNVNIVFPDRSIRSAALAWTKTSDPNQRPYHCPDFVLEFKEKHEDLKSAKKRMKEFVSNGCSLAWLVDEKREVIYIFQKSKIRMEFGLNKKLSGSTVLQGLELDLAALLSDKAK